MNEWSYKMYIDTEDYLEVLYSFKKINKHVAKIISTYCDYDYNNDYIWTKVMRCRDNLNHYYILEIDDLTETDNCGCGGYCHVDYI